MSTPNGRWNSWGVATHELSPKSSKSAVHPKYVKTVFEIDDIQKQSFMDLVDKSSLLKTVIDMEKDDKNILGLMTDVQCKLFNPSYEVPDLVDSKLEDHYNFIQEMVTSKEYRELIEITSNNRFASALASANIIQNIRQLSVEEEQDVESYRDVIRDALKRTIIKIQETESDIAAYSNALGDYNGRVANAEQKLKYAEILQNSPKMKRVASILGRLKQIAAQKQKTKIKHGVDEIVGIEVGDELDRIIPSELAMLADPELEDIFSVNYIEKSIIQYEMTGTEMLGKGPIVVMVDNSGSMAGPKEEWSKALMFALAAIAKKQKRTFAVIYFNSRVCKDFPKIYKKGQISLEEVSYLVEYFSGGGTDFMEPLAAGMGIIGDDEDFEKADLVMITDGFCEISGAFEEKFAEWKSVCGAHLYTIGMVHRMKHNTAIVRISDQVFNYMDLQGDEDGVGRQIEDKVLAI